MAKILVLSTFDTRLSGHGWALSKSLEQQEHEVCFISLHKRFTIENNHYFFDGVSTWRYLNIWRNLYIYLDSFVLHKFLQPDSLHCFQTTGLYGISAKKILKKCPFTPQFIYITWTSCFLIPKTIRRLYDLTGAKIIFSMVDEAILAGCHYPANCDGYLNGCKNCPGVRHFKCLPRRLVAQKEKYWKNMPAEIHGSNYDIKLAEKTPFLSHMTKFGSVAVPDTTPVFSKHEARAYFKIADNDYVIFAGANNLLEKRKGFKLLIAAINILANSIDISHPITLLLIGHSSGDLPFNIDSRINLVIRDFLPYEDFYKAYYACDVYASPTLADSGPRMVNYSIACGRPVVAFPVGVAVDLVVHENTGYFAEYGNSEDFSAGLLFFYKKMRVNYMT